VAGSLDDWVGNTFGHVRKEIRSLLDRLVVLRADTARLGPSYEETKLVERLAELYDWEETLWRQCSCVQWLAEGDKNTRFFHMWASQRKKRNHISSLKKPDGLVTEDDSEMAELTTQFVRAFSSLPSFVC
jgi:hypothetical protein